MMFRVRIDTQGDDVAKFNDKCLDFAKLYSEQYMVMYHIKQDNTHVHMYINSEYYNNDASFRQRVKRFFNITKSTDYSIQKCDPQRVNEYLSYLYNTKHGNVPVLIGHNLDSNLVIECEKAAKDMAEDYDDRQKKRKSDSTVTQYEMAMEVVDMLKPRQITIERHTIELFTDITKLAIDVHHKYKKGFCEFSLRKVIIIAYTKVEGGKQHLVDKMVNNFFYK